MKKVLIHFKKTFFPLILLLSFLFITNQSLAVSGSPSITNLFGAPGDVVESIYRIGNSENTPRNLNISFHDFNINPETGAKEYLDEPTPRGLMSWIEVEEDTKYADPNKTKEFKYTINIPSAAAPGSYATAVFAMANNPDPNEEAIGVVGRVISLVYLTIEGDYTEKLELESFDVSQSNGRTIFQSTFLNEGDVNIAPTGTIKIYDNSGNQIKNIYAITQEFNGQVVDVETKDELIFNSSLIQVLPVEKKLIITEFENRRIDTGKYLAKLELYYGEKNEKIEASTNLDIIENFNIKDFYTEKIFNSNLPINFYATIKNNGATQITPSGYFEVRNVFGSQKFRVDFTSEELTLNGGEEITINNIIWDNGFALGYYNAKISIKVGDKTYNESLVFWVASWWQVAIGILILLILLFLIYKGIRGYIVMTKKLKEIETKST